MITSLLLALSLFGCSTVTPGSVVLQVNLTSQNEDSRYEVIRGGRYFSSINCDFYEIPLMEQRTVWSKSSEGNKTDESITFAGKDGQPVNVDVGVGFQIIDQDADIVSMVRKYGPDLNQVIDGRVRDSVRNQMNLCSNEYSVEEIYGEKKNNLMDCVFQKVNEEYEPNGLKIARITLNSEIRLPQKVKDAMEASIAASQEAEKTHRQVDQTVAEGQKTIAAATADAEATRIRTESEARANAVLTESITPQLLELKRLEVQKAQAERWDGKLPNTMLGNSMPFIDVSKLQ